MDTQFKLGGSFPSRMPADFTQAFAEWQDRVRAIQAGTEIQQAIKALAFEHVLTLARPHHFPTQRPELYRFALKELASRELTPEQRDQVGDAWSYVRRHAMNAENGLGPLLTLSEIRKLNQMRSN